MSNSEQSRQDADMHERPEGKHERGINLPLLYSLIIAALIAASTIASLIVLPFFHRR